MVLQKVFLHCRNSGNKIDGLVISCRLGMEVDD